MASSCASLRPVEQRASSFARALGRFHLLSGPFAVAPAGSTGLTIRYGDEGAEFVHAVAPGVTGTVCIPRVVWSFFPLDRLLGVDAIADSRPVLAAQVTELADGVFVGMSLSHAAADWTTFWDLFNTWSEISRNKSDISTAAPPLERWFHDGCPVPIPLPFAKVQDMARPFERPPRQECSLRFSPESVTKLTAKANAETVAGGGTATISSLQAVAAHVWRAACRARALAPDQETTCALPVGCRTRVKGMPQVYLGNAVAGAVGRSAVGEILGDGRLGWAAWLLTRAVASFGEASARETLARWPRER